MTTPFDRTSRSILLADDDEEVRIGVADVLRALGLEVMQAETGLEALELVRLRPVQAALLDWHMPGCSGLEALPKLRAERVGLPCILYSGNLTEEMERLAREAGAFSVLRKPVVPDLLRAEVMRALAIAPYFPN